MSAPKWTTKHGFFLQMGGFKLVYAQEKDDASISFFTEYSYRYQSRLGVGMWEGVLQFDSFRRLLQQHKIDFPSTTAEEIDDRS